MVKWESKCIFNKKIILLYSLLKQLKRSSPIPKSLISCPVQRLLRLLAGVISLRGSCLAFLSTIFSKSKITLSMLLTKGQAEVPVFQIWNQPFKTLRVYAKNKVFDCTGTLKDYEKVSSLVPADRQSLINLDAVQNYDEKGHRLFWSRHCPFRSRPAAVCHVETECNKKRAVISSFLYLT